MSLGADAAARLSALGAVPMAPGLSEDEVAHIESTFGFTFADDHRDFLTAALPVGEAWPNWRSEGRRSLQKRMQLPVDGLLFDVEWGHFWVDGWGPRPARMKDALRSARYQLARVPQLLPVYSHHYLPAGAGAIGRPVLSVVRTAVVAVGADLVDYVDNAFGSGGERDASASAAVAFWSDLITRAGE
jgi:hypothetical protein